MTRPSLWILAALVTLASVGAVLAFVDLGELAADVRHLDLRALFLLVIALQAQQYLGSVRFRRFLPQVKIGWLKGWLIENIAGLATFVLPFGLGEGARIWAWKRMGGTRLSLAGTSYLLTRAIDATVVLALLTGLSLLPIGGEAILNGGVRLVLALGAIALAALWGLVLGRGQAWGTRLALRLEGGNRSRIACGLASLARAFADAAALPAADLAVAALASLLFWAVQMGETFILAHATGLDLSFAQVLVVYMAWWVAALLPVQGFIRTGTHQAGWVGGLVLVGVPVDQAMLAATVTHLLLLLRTVLAQGVTAVLYLFVARSRRKGNS
ncbi:lysylphosphatidylglycerol synthase domain-containing protein [Oleispirillum naphthae]|uniref:lysylphosphatidylglycerol synthase domain-containing protein n=1 Tax=Oleispirillum naphthae TaxID=2838853 RepID=UPI0030822CC3